MTKARGSNCHTATAEQVVARRRLARAISDALSMRQTVPCIENPLLFDGAGGIKANLEAARLCATCPAFAECDAYRRTGAVRDGLIMAAQRT